MIIHTVATAALLLLWSRHLADIAMVVVNPAQCHIFRHFKAVVVGLQHLLVGDENLWHLSRIADRVGKKLTLPGNDIRKTLHAVFVGIAVHAGVMHATHTESVHRINATAFSYALCPVVLHHFPVGLPVPLLFTEPLLAPFPFIVAKHLLAVAGTQYEIILASHLNILGVSPECLCACVHSGPEHIGTKTEKKFRHLSVGIRTYVLSFRIHLLCSPGIKTEILIVDKHTTELHGRLLGSHRIARYIKRHPCLRNHVGPPHIWRHTGQS